MFRIMGSTYFFKDYADFKSKDIDYWEIIDELDDCNYYSRRIVSVSKKEEFFSFRRVSKEEHIKQVFNVGLPMAVGKFLIPEFCNEIGFTIDELRQLQPLIDNLDEAHLYEQVIYNAYLKNGDFILTQEQRDNAYKSYKMTRNQ